MLKCTLGCFVSSCIWYFMSNLVVFTTISSPTKTAGKHGRDGKVFGISFLIMVCLDPTQYVPQQKQWESMVGMDKYLVFHV